MKKYLTIAAGLIASATLVLAAAPAMAGHVDVDVNIGLPGLYQAPVYVQPRPVYVQPEAVYVQQEPVYVQPRPVYIQQVREHDWRERQLRARQWQERHRHEDRHDDRWDEHRDHDRGEHRGHDD